MKIQPLVDFLTPSYFSLPGRAMRYVADSRFGERAIINNGTERVAVYAVRFFANIVICAIAYAEIARTVVIIPLALGASLFSLIAAYLCCADENSLRFGKRCFQLFIEEVIHGLPHAVALACLPVTLLVYSIAGKTLTSKIKPTGFNTYASSGYEWLGNEESIERALRTDDAEFLAHFVREQPALQQETMLNRILTLKPRISHFSDTGEMWMDSYDDHHHSLDDSFCYRFLGSGKPQVIRNVSKLYRLGMPINIETLRIFQMIMQKKNYTQRDGINSGYLFVERADLGFKASLGSIEYPFSSIPRPHSTPFLWNPIYYWRYLHFYHFPRDRSPPTYPVVELDRLIETIKKETQDAVEQGLKASIQNGTEVMSQVVTAYVVGQDPFPHWELVERAEAQRIEEG